MSATGGAFGGTSEGLTGSVGDSVLQVAAGFVHTCAHLAHITVRCWGHNAEGELGDGTTTTWRLRPVAITSVDALAVGPHTVCVTWASATPSLFPLWSL
jgi:hypothetical protein